MKDFSVFEPRERANFERDEAVFLMSARKGYVQPLFNFGIQSALRLLTAFNPDMNLTGEKNASRKYRQA